MKKHGDPRRIAYSAEEMRWLEANLNLVIPDYHRAFCDTFDRQDVTASNLKGLRQRKGWKVGRIGRTTGRRHLYSPTEIAWLRNNCTMPTIEWHRSFCFIFARSDITVRQLRILRRNEGWLTGRTGRFEKGLIPHNKGNPNFFKTPEARARSISKLRPHPTRPGYEFIGRQNGFVNIIVAQPDGRTTRCVPKQRWLWEKANGPIPKDMVLKCLSNDKTNCDLSNWSLVPRGLILRLDGRNGRGYRSAPPELKLTIMAVAKLAHHLGALKRRKSS